MARAKTSVRRGFSLMEVLVASAILVTATIGVVGALRLYASIVTADVERTQAAILVQEAAEALQLMRDVSWDTEIDPLALDTAYHLAWDGSSYTATTTEVVLHERFTRTVTLSAVLRDANDDIAEIGTTDDDTRQVTVQVYRESDDTEILSSDLFLHNVYEYEAE